MDSNSCKDSAELLAAILVPSVAAVINLLIYVCSKCTYHVSKMQSMYNLLQGLFILCFTNQYIHHCSTCWPYNRFVSCHMISLFISEE